jgi:hypothetical protein
MEGGEGGADKTVGQGLVATGDSASVVVGKGGSWRRREENTFAGKGTSEGSRKVRKVLRELIRCRKPNTDGSISSAHVAFYVFGFRASLNGECRLQVLHLKPWLYHSRGCPCPYKTVCPGAMTR